MFEIPVTRHFSQIPRYQEILRVLVQHGFGSMMNLLPINRKWLQRLRPFPTTAPQTLPVHFRQALEELGPTFVKLGQVLSTRPDILPPTYITELARLQDAVPPVPWEAIHAVLRSELPISLEQIFTSIEQTPLASASLGQVHAATLTNGKEIVIKIQRPHIRAAIDTDLDILQDVAHYTQQYTTLGKTYSVEEIAADFAVTLLAELNYLREGRNADLFRENFRAQAGIYIPHIYWEYTTQRVLVMERLRGIKVNDISALKATGHDCTQIANHSAYFIIKEVLEDGFFHADPHPGNLIVLADGSLGVMDFGMVGHLSQRDRTDLIRIYTTAVRMDANGIVDELVHIGAAPPDVKRHALVRDVTRALHNYKGLPLQEISVADALETIQHLVFEHHLRLPSNLWLLGKSLAMMEGVGRQLEPDFDIFAFSKPYVGKLIRQTVLPNRHQVEKLLHQTLIWGDILDEVPRAVLLLLSRLEKNEPIPLALTNQNLSVLDTLVTRLSLSLIIAGMTIGLAFVISTLGETGVWFQAIFIPLFVVTLALGAWVMISIIRK
ncbi:MAG TPA: AarF/ABC1/UbiB kinase family protein [Thermoflexia bacterium]|nr:AarF/ABC1/UbiB kinase family protein [Thermoflexia bacterium]